MTLVSALAAFSTIALQGGTLTLADKVVQVTYPSPNVRQIPDEVKNWDGFTGLSASQRAWPTPFHAPGDWSSIASKLADLGPASKDVALWRTRIFIVTQTDSAAVGSDGLIRQRRQRLSPKQVDELLKALARVPGYARVATNGALNISLEVSVDNDPVAFAVNPAVTRGTTAVNQPNLAWKNDYALSRTNRGAYVAEDRIFRGPYKTVLVLDATQLEPLLSQELDGDSFTKYVADQVAMQALLRWYELGVFRAPIVTAPSAGFHQPTLSGLFPDKVWPILASDEVSFEALKELYDFAKETSPETQGGVEVPQRSASFSGNVTVSVENDPDRGPVLRYSENSPVRKGGFALPYQNIDSSKTPYLSFWVKTNSRDALAVRISDGSSKERFPLIKAIPSVSDGTWQQVVIDLRNQQPRTIQELYIGPIEDDADRGQVGEIAYFFDDFQLLAEGTPTPPKADQDSELNQRAQAAKNLSAAELLKDPSDFVKLNGLVLRETAYSASDEEALSQLTRSVNGRVAEEAVKRLAQLGTPTAVAEVQRLVSSSPFERVKQAAGVEIGKLGDAKAAGILSRLFASRSWHTRLAGAKSITLLPGDEAAVISMTFLQETDPQIRLALTRTANAQNSVVQKRFLWSAVNDPSDAVRAESAWRLITSGVENLAAEGYKLIRDDSVWVRQNLVNRMQADPKDEHRSALRIAVVDLSPFVRAQALQALAKQPGDVSTDEVSNTFTDKFPVVQLALIDLAKAKKLTLPSTALENLKSSIDPRVVERMKEIEG